MIAFLEGNFIHKSPANIIIDVNGVGYDVHISLNTFDKIQKLTKGRLHTFVKYSELEQNIYGFYDEVEKNLFLLLISVSGVGASTARMMLSGMQPSEIAYAIANDQDKALEKIKGIGAKTAKRIIVELKDKVQKANWGSDSVISNTTLPQNNLEQDALNALVSLGIAKNMAANAVAKVLKTQPELNDIQDIIKLSLKNL